MYFFLSVNFRETFRIRILKPNSFNVQKERIAAN